MPVNFSDLIATLDKHDLVTITGDAPISAPVTEDAREVQAGGVFVARRGLTSDGHAYIQQAIANGAAAIVGERELTGLSVPYAQVKDAGQAIGYLAAAYHDFPSQKLIVIGVTGTDGKTTTTTLIQSILNRATNGKTGYISTIAADLGGQTSDTGLHVTTPLAHQVQAYLAQMVANGMTHCVLEMTSHGLAQGRLNGVAIDVAVMTNVRHEHLDYHGTFDNYREAKARMFRMLATSTRKQDTFGNDVPKISVINNDDPNAQFFADIPADRVLTYSLHADADFKAQDLRYEVDQISFSLPDRWTDLDDTDLMREFALNLLGQFNVYNALAAICATTKLIDAEDETIPAMMSDGLEAVEAISGRMERINEGQAFMAIVDFAHTPNALENALTACRDMLTMNDNGGRLIAVFGSAGLRDVEKRRMMAETSAQLADFTIFTAEDPRTESLDDILMMMARGAEAQGGVDGETFIRVRDRGEALFRACEMAQSGDIVIACGKGHEQSMCFGTVEHPWDDRDALRAALRGNPLRTLPTAQG